MHLHGKSCFGGWDSKVYHIAAGFWRFTVAIEIKQRIKGMLTDKTHNVQST